MASSFELKLDGQRVRFTDSGKVAVIDAINALVGPVADAREVMRHIREEDPSLLNNCEKHRFRDGGAEPVMDVEGWNRVIQIILSGPYLSSFEPF